MSITLCQHGAGQWTSIMPKPDNSANTAISDVNADWLHNSLAPAVSQMVASSSIALKREGSSRQQGSQALMLLPRHCPWPRCWNDLPCHVPWPAASTSISSTTSDAAALLLCSPTLGAGCRGGHIARDPHPSKAPPAICRLVLPVYFEELLR